MLVKVDKPFQTTHATVGYIVAAQATLQDSMILVFTESLYQLGLRVSN